MDEFDFQLERRRIAQNGERTLFQKRSEHELRVQQRELAALEREVAALTGSSPSLKAAADERLEREITALRDRHAERERRSAEFRRIDAQVQAVAKRPKRIRGVSGAIYELVEGPDGMPTVKKTPPAS